MLSLNSGESSLFSHKSCSKCGRQKFISQVKGELENQCMSCLDMQMHKEILVEQVLNLFLKIHAKCYLD